MAFQARHRWIIQRLQIGFGFHDEAEIEELMKSNKIMDKLNYFFRQEGPSKIFFYYQARKYYDDGDSCESDGEKIKELFITDGFEEPLRERAVYFIKNERHLNYDAGSSPENSAIFQLDPASANDHLLSFGIVESSLLLSLETMMSHLYGPLLQGREEGEWGQADAESRNDFLHGLRSFCGDIQENLKAMTNGLELRKPEKKYDPNDSRSLSRLSTDEAAVLHFVDLIQDWCKQTETYLEDSDQGRWESTDSGPDTELEYWKHRLQRLMGITEQLKTKECKMVTSVLGVVSKLQDGGANRMSISSHLRQWKQIDTNITEACNEAKDNVKYLATLERFIEPLYSGTPVTVIDSLPALMNSIKMIHTIARYYNTTERMTRLFMKITNQMITLCKRNIIGSNPPEYIWDKDPEKLLVDLEACLRLNEAYQEQYRLTKDKLLTMPKGKQFDFSETQIFGKFDLFSRRIVKLIDMFSTIHQFRSLSHHSLEGMDALTNSFNRIISEFKGNKHDLLDYHNNKFDRDYVEFNIQISDLEASLQQFINSSFESITSIEQSLILLKQFQAILQRESLRSDLDSKLTVIFHNYGLDLTNVQDIYEKFRHDPPTARNLPPVAGNILWSRHLLRRIEEPMRKFESNPTVLATKDSKKIIKTYNKVARTLVAFEYLWYEAWCRSIETAKAGLHATLIIKHPENGKLYVNFDKEILQLIREAKCLNRMGIEIPENARIVMLQEEKFKAYYNDLTYTLKEYDRITAKIIPVTAPLLAHHLGDLQQKLRPGLVTLSWTSMNIDGYKMQIHVALQRLEELINNVIDIIENRVEKNLKVVAKAFLVNLPTDQSFTLDEFVRMQERHVASVTMLLGAKNLEVENAVEDVLRLTREYSLDVSGAYSTSREYSSSMLEAVETFRGYYKNLFYRALLNCTKQSLNAIKKRVCSKAGTGFLFLERPFFEVDVQLSVPSVRLSPSLEDIQRAINRSAVAVLKSSKSLHEWGQQDVFPEQSRTTFFEKLGCDTEIIKVAILLTGALHGTKNQVHEYLSTFKKYDWLWKEDMEFRYNQFMKRNPSIQDFENELRNFMSVEAEINHIAPVHNIAVLCLNTKNLKLQLRNECRQWKVQYSDKVHHQAKFALSRLTEYIRVTTIKLNTQVDSLDSLRFAMGILKEIREKESSIEMEINPILDMYDMLEHFLPGGYMDKEEMDQKSVIRGLWRKLVDYAEEVTDNLSDVQGIFKRQLLKDVKDFQADVGLFRSEYIENGPMTSGLQPTEAVERLKRFKELILIRERKLEVYAAGEELFGMRPTEYPELLKTKKELLLLDQLYSLYMDVVGTLEEYRAIPWRQVATNIQAMTDCFTIFDGRCKKLPKKLCEWEAYHIMRRDITDFMEILPLVTELSQECVKTRHWEDIVKLCGSPLPFDNDSLQFAAILDANLLRFKEEIEYICDSAQKQLQIENKIRDIKERWAGTSFEFGEWKTRNVPILRAYGVVIEDLEESQLQLQAMLAMRHVVFFKEFVQLKLSQLSDTSDMLELWIKVQNLWMSLESVFTGGDIAKQMPVEAKKFAKVDKDWIKVMMKASEIGSVTGCCSNELIRSTLPILFGELEKCQKSLEGYLEQKRKKFPRFYFVSNPVLLLLLSKGSDPSSIQPYYEKIFDSIDQVCHDLRQGGDKRKIIRIKSKCGAEEEAVTLANPILADGNIEDWLSMLEKEMRMTMKGLCRQAAVECNSVSLRDFISKNCGQFALLGIQFVWTAESQEALQKCRSTKGIMQTTTKKQNSTLSELSSLCLTDLGSIINRRKVEMLITVQLHQRDCFAGLCKLYKEKKTIDPTDFEWLRQVRFYWKNSPNQDHLGQDACLISICDVDFKYAFEYLGCKERLVITPLTDRAYITLSQALNMHLGGAPVGPAGTGKTETVKDLGRSLGIYVIVTNCTDQQRYSDMAKIFKGLCQGGLWGCFDEFNRIELPVLSVVAQQVLSITSAKRLQASTFYFPGDQQSIGLKEDAAYFITMNPGYQGRQELPENLKSLFRSVSMMVPDREIIMKVKLCAAGYESFVDLARKFKTLYNIVEQQLSKQKHYDFGLRNILSVLRTAGVTKRENLLLNEEFLLMTTLRDMNLSKLVAQDIPIFLSLLKDIFPNAEFKNQTRYPDVSQAITEVIEKNGLTSAHSWNSKIIQLYDTTLVRHGVILVGPAGSGKSEITRTLQLALSNHTKIPHKQIRMNPKAIRTEEMFGETDRLSGEWVDGVFASIWAKYNERSRRDISWIVCDGPVDAVWIENLNTVLDDNKILTLANGDRIQMSDNCKIMFEVEDLRNASPATVSRAGIIYVSNTDLDWEPYVQSWLLQRTERQQNILKQLFKRLIGDSSIVLKGNLFQYISRSCRPLVKLPHIALIQSCCRLLNCFMISMDLLEDSADFEIELERVFCFALCWAFGGILDVEDRLKFQNYLCERSNQLPKGVQLDKGNIFDFFIHSATLEWERWSTDLGENLLLKDENPSSLIMPTTDTERSLYIMSSMYSNCHSLMLIGEPGVGKSTLVRLFVETKRSTDEILFKTAILSGCTNPGDLQYKLETELDKRGGKTYGPGNGRKLIFFIDDISVPAQNCWGDQPTMEVLRQLVETNTLCFLEKDKRGDMKCVEDVRYITAMRYPKDGANDIPNRLKRHFFILNCTTPSPDVIDSIYGQLLRWKFEGIEGPSRKSVLECLGKLVDASIQLVQWVKKSMLPTPQKNHYFFNLRDLSRVFLGVLRAPCDSITSEKPLIKLWRHECDRVFSDRLISIEEKGKFRDQISQITEAILLKSVKEKVDLQGIFLDFLRDTPSNESGEVPAEIPKIYECVPDIQQVRGRVQQLLDQFNLDNPSKKMNLILFDEALLHLLRISRVLGMPRSNMMLVGVGGSGKQSLARLASIIAGYHIFQLSVSKAYNLSSFLDDIRSLFKLCGQSGKQVMFLIPESDLINDSFLEQINSLLAIGDIPGLFPRDELTVMTSELRSVMQKQKPNIPDTNDNLIRFFFERVRSNMHILLLFSPTNRLFAHRCRQFPNLINSCTIDWFLPWPEDALVAVTRAYLGSFEMEATELAKENLMAQMSQIHLLVTEACEEYFAKRGRPVFQTPRSFLGFLQTYRILYAENLDEINKMEISINIGLQKLVQGARDVETMKVVLKEEETKLLIAEDAANKMLETLQIKSLEAKKESDVVQCIKDQCEQDAAMILKEKQDAEEDLKKAQPFLDEAERAASSIKTNDLNELKKLPKPADVIKLIFDCVGILQMSPLVRVEKSPVTLGVAKDKKNFDFILDSFQLVKSGMLADTRFLQNIFHFSKHQKDNINEETIELMMPYLELDGFSAVVAKNASKAAEGLFCWVKAMTMYHEASKVVKPKLEALRIAEGKFEAAQASLQSSEEKLAKCQAILNRLQEDFQTQMEEKGKVEQYAQATKKKMEQATALITGLGGERTRWTEDSNRFIERKAHLIGDCIIGSAFLNYCGPFNKEYRDMITSKYIPEVLQRKNIPVSANLAFDTFLVDNNRITDWKIFGLPSDPLSIQNGILVERSQRFPLLIDPQGQAMAWLAKREMQRLPSFGRITVCHPKLRDHFEYCLSEGKTLILEGVDLDLDTAFNNVLEKNFITRAKSRFVSIMDRVCEYHEDFRLYLMTRVQNPHFSPEMQARIMLVDFTVTQKGLEEQLLAQVIQKEQKSLEEQLLRVQTDLYTNTKALGDLDSLLLERLSTNTGNLLDDLEVINVLADTKTKATEVNDKIFVAEEVKKGIDEKRDQYRPVATRGAVLYFSIVDFSRVNSMYQTSLDQFLVLFRKAIDFAERSNLASKRVGNILEGLTYVVFRYINRGLYEKDRISFLLVLALKILVATDSIQPSDIALFVAAGASRKIQTEQGKPFLWMSNQAWLNAIQLSSEKPHFKNLLEDLIRQEVQWKKWYEENEPENVPVPDYEGILFDNRSINANLSFHRLLLIRCLREDRTILAVNNFLRSLEVIECPNSVLSKLPGLGPRYTEAVTDTVESVFNDMTPETPVLYLLSPGADPTESVELLARKKRQMVQCISMGEGQDGVATKAINTAVLNGSWVLLQNCHLGLAYMDTLEEILAKIKETASPEFRLFLTSEPHPSFPISILQKSMKVTNEPPSGIRAGMLRSFTVLVDQDKLDRIESGNWRTLVYSLCFLHSIVQERQKFGALGFTVPYEFNSSDLSSSLNFLEKHLYSSTLSWPTIQYMVAEVHYGGRITDELDRRLFNSYCEAWLNPLILNPAFSFSPEALILKSQAPFDYCIPQAADIEEIHRFICTFPKVDSPEIFGLHPNADLTYRVKETVLLLQNILETQPKDAVSTKGETKEAIVAKKIKELISSVPNDFVEDDCISVIKNKLGGMEIPVNVFLMQELQHFQRIIQLVRSNLIDCQRFLAGEITITMSLRNTIDAVFEGKVPQSWLFYNSGEELSWLVTALGVWFAGFTERSVQFRTWLEKGKPYSFWLAGFYNPQGLLTAMKQEVTRSHLSERWALDDVVYHSEVTDYEKLDQIKQAPREGVLLHGLILDGAAWNKIEGTIVEAEPKKLFNNLPVLYVTATTKSQKKNRAQDYGPYGGYETPCYKYAVRTDRYYIFSVILSSRDHRPLHWTLRGVALLCTTE